MKRAAGCTAVLVVGFGLAACQEQVVAPQAARWEAQASVVETQALAVSPELQSADLGAGTVFDLRGASPAINPEDYICPASTAISDWWAGAFYASLAENYSAVATLYNLRTDIVPTYDALLYETNATPQYFGYAGQYTDLLVKTDKRVKRFWDIDGSAIQLLGMHGTMLLDVERVARVYRTVFGLSAPVAQGYAQTVRSALLQVPSMATGNHPFFSFNAVAFSPSSSAIPDKIVIGDGVLAGYEALGFADVAPQAVYAHEFAHHIQTARGYFGDEYATVGDPAEQTRYTELMADAMAAYYLTHKRGATMNQKRVEQFLQVFFEIGDCSFTNAGHHGTPNQRLAAARFGFEIAAQAKVHGVVMTAQQFHDLFVAAYPGMIAPDAS